jgi:hypothetical protein
VKTYAWSEDTQSEVEIIRVKGRTLRACYGCGGAGCYECNGEGYA